MDEVKFIRVSSAGSVTDWAYRSKAELEEVLKIYFGPNYHSIERIELQEDSVQLPEYFRSWADNNPNAGTLLL